MVILCIFVDDVKGSFDGLSTELRCAWGAGVVLKLGGVARMELNYVVPLAVHPGDRWVML